MQEAAGEAVNGVIACVHVAQRIDEVEHKQLLQGAAHLRWRQVADGGDKVEGVALRLNQRHRQQHTTAALVQVIPGPAVKIGIEILHRRAACTLQICQQHGQVDAFVQLAYHQQQGQRIAAHHRVDGAQIDAGCRQRRHPLLEARLAQQGQRIRLAQLRHVVKVYIGFAHQLLARGEHDLGGIDQRAQQRQQRSDVQRRLQVIDHHKVWGALEYRAQQAERCLRVAQ